MAYLFNDAAVDNLKVTSTPITAAPFTMACWARSDDQTAAQACFSIGNSGVAAQFWDLLFTGNVAGDPLRFRSVVTTAGSASTSSSYVAGTWHHCCGVETSATARAVFLDGAGKGTDTTSRAPGSSNNIVVGADASSGLASPFSGDVAEAAIWNVALTDAEVAILAKGVKPYLVRPDKLVFYAPLLNTPVEIIGKRTLTATGAVPSTTVPIHPHIFGMAKRQGRKMVTAVAAAGTAVLRTLMGVGT